MLILVIFILKCVMLVRLRVNFDKVINAEIAKSYIPKLILSLYGGGGKYGGCIEVLLN